MIKLRKLIKRGFFLLLVGEIIFFFNPYPLRAASLTSAKDTLETSRLSFHGKNAANLTPGTTIIQMATSGTPSTSTANLFPGDTVVYTITTNTYTVDQIIDSDEFSVTSALDGADDDLDDEFVVDRTSHHTISFDTATAISNGAIKIRVKADASGSNDGNPDDDGWDFNSFGNDVTCPSDVATFYDFVTGTATASGDTGCTAGYHCFECRYSGPGNPSQSLVIGIGTTTPELINPSAASGHAEGTADTYSIIFDNLDSSDVAIDSTTIKVAIIESVRVTATVDPTITFTITGVSADSGSYCGITRTASSADSTATAVPFGSLTLGAFNDAQQQLSCITNASGGYAITTMSNDPLSVEGEHSTELADTDCDAEDCDYDDVGEWSTENDASGFGYSLQNIDASTVPFQYNSSLESCTGAGYCAQAFPDKSQDDVAFEIMSNSSTPSTTEDAYLCYRIAVSTGQTAGDYENAITYVATATF